MEDMATPTLTTTHILDIMEAIYHIISLDELKTWLDYDNYDWFCEMAPRYGL